MGSSFQSLMDEFVRVRDAEYRNIPEEAAARMEAVEDTILGMLALLRDRFEQG